MADRGFVHLHNHTEYSMLDGAQRLKPLMAEVARQGMPAIAMTDHGNQFGAYDFWKAGAAAGLNPIIGIEAYLSPKVARTHKQPVFWGNGGKDDVSGRGAYTHMTMWVETTQGMHNLFRMNSIASAEGMYRKPRMDEDLLPAHTGGVIASTGCPSSFYGDGYYIESAAKMRHLWRDHPEACDTTLDIAARCQMEFVEGEGRLMPIFACPPGHTEESWPRHEVTARLSRCFPGGVPAAVRDQGEPRTQVDARLDFDLDFVERRHG